MVNFPPDYCPYCGDRLTEVDPPTVHRCSACEEYVFYNPAPGASVAVVDGDRILLVEDFREAGTWTLPEGRIEAGERPRDGAARELREETGLSVDPADLVFFFDTAGEPEPNLHSTGVDFAVPRSAVSGDLDAGSDATDARFWTVAAFEASDHALADSHVDRFGADDLGWLLDDARDALARADAGGDAG